MLQQYCSKTVFIVCETEKFKKFPLSFRKHLGFNTLAIGNPFYK